MSFRDDVRLTQVRPKKCGLGDAIRSMDPDFAEEVCEALHDLSLGATALTGKLQSLGYNVNRSQVFYCRKQCECGAIPDAK